MAVIDVSVSLPENLTKEQETGVQEAIMRYAQDVVGSFAANQGAHSSEKSSTLVTKLRLGVPDGEEYYENSRRVMNESFDHRRELLRDSLGVVDVAKLLNISRQAVHNKAARHPASLFAVKEQGALRFPSWQFDSLQHDGIVSGIPELVAVLNAAHVAPIAQLSWMTIENPYLEGRTPLQALKDRDSSRVLDTAHLVGSR